jgi:ABC-type multidrug transport system fused ATPase/permease subunit
MTMAATYVGEKTGWHAANALRADIAKHTLDLDMSFHKKQTPGIMIERIDGDVASLNRFFSQMVLQIGGSLLLLTSSVGVLLYLEWRMGILLLVYALVAMWVLFGFRGIAVPFWEAAREASAQLFGFLEERLAGLEDIRGLGARSHVLRRLVILMNEKNKFDTLGRVYGSLTWIIPMVLSSMLTVMILAVGVWLYLSNEISIGLIVMTMFYGDLIMRPIRTISSEIDQLQQASAGILRIAEL